mgnify:CR=1 FL=1
MKVLVVPDGIVGVEGLVKIPVETRLLKMVEEGRGMSVGKTTLSKQFESSGNERPRRRFPSLCYPT